MSKPNQRRTMKESDAILQAAAARRVHSPVILTGVKVATTITMIQPEQFPRLGVDERYQRVRIGGEVNELIHAIRNGGEIPDPVDIAQRPDGSLWLVDGQQRFWAHSECGVPLKAHIHQVEDLVAESRLFVALNSRRKVNTRTIIKGWPGLAGEFLRRMQTSDRSPIKGMIDFGQNSSLPLDAPSVVKGVLVVTTGLEYPSGDMATRMLPRIDAALKVPGMIAWAEAFVDLIAAVFSMQPNAGRVRVLPVIALAAVAHRKYVEAGRPAFPHSCARLRNTNWDTLVPSHAKQYLPVLEREIERRWK